VISIFYVFLGGGTGSVVRYLLGKGISGQATGFPMGTLAANVLALVVMGLVLVLYKARGADWMNPFVVAGFCGGLSTFSTFSFETAQLIRDGHLWAAGLNLILSVGAGLGTGLFFLRNH
jgi:CrcB protein